MLNFFRACAFLPLFLIAGKAFPQKLNSKFGDIPISELEMTVYKLDPGADAVVLSDCANAELVYSGNSFEIDQNRDVRIKIINKNGFDYANVEIPYYILDKVIKVEASTFNLENGKIVETKIPKKSFLIENVNKYGRILRIAFPNVHEGSIIEYRFQYITNSIHEFIPWDFQSEIPIRYTEFTASIPDFFTYRATLKGKNTSVVKRSNSQNLIFGGFSTTESITTWTGTNIPAFREEPFITGANDHLIKLEFELAGVSFPGSRYEEITPTYLTLSKKLLDREDFGIALRNASFLEEPTRKLISGVTDELTKLRKIHHFISNKILWNGKDDYTASNTLRKIYKEERGNSADINLILIAMLRLAGINAEPVILSTRSNGSLHPFIAMIQRFNYIVARVPIDGKEYLVDATEPLLPFNNLPFECLNSQGRSVDPTRSEWVNLTNKEKNISSSSITLKMDENGVLEGKINSSFTSYYAFSKRKFIQLESLDGYKDYIKSNHANWDIQNFEVQNIDSIDNALTENYDIKVENGAQKSSIGLMFNPFIIEKEEENPFSNEERKYPIDFGCPILKIYSLNLKIPAGYEVDEMPSSLSIKLPENGGGFLFNCEVKENTIMIQSKLTLDQIQYRAEDYITLREFYAQIMRKQSELIVLKKKV